LSRSEQASPEAANQARVAAIEEQIETLHIQIESCRKAAIAAQMAVASGTATLVAWIGDLAGFGDMTALVFALALILGGIVWFGANHASRAAAVAAIAAAERTRAALIQSLPMDVIEGG
jgi:hypothetical protein